MEYISRESIISGHHSEAAEVLMCEDHHDHKIIKDDRGVLRWKKNEMVETALAGRFNLNDMIRLLHYLGYDKNTEIYRKLYRDLGYSLYGYWEVFYWEANNEAAGEYKQNAK